jgi:Cu-Zn family superoxide dismutase
MLRNIMILTACSAAALAGCTKAKKTPVETPADTTVFEAPMGSPAPVDQNASFAVADLASKAGGLTGTVTFATVPAPEGSGSSLIVTADLKNEIPGDHGIHIHEFGDCSGEDFKSAGAHLNPTGLTHAGPTDAVRHFGDLGNIKVDENGNGQLTETLTFVDQPVAALQELIIGKAVIVHEGVDDLKTQPSGDSGKPIACGAIDKAETVAH